MKDLLQRVLARRSRLVIVVAALYSAACASVLLTHAGGDAVARQLGAWGTFPLSIAILITLWPSMTGAHLNRRRRLAWQLMFAAVAFDLVAGIGWSFDAVFENVTIGSWPDVVYLFYYPLAAAACVLFYVELGGRMNTPRAVVDFATVVIGFGSLLWFTALAPLGHMSGHELAAKWSYVGYGLGNAMALFAGALLAMQIADWRAERSLVWLLVAMVMTLVADLLWVNRELRGEYEVGAAIDVAYYAFYFALLIAVRYQFVDRARASAPLGLAGALRGSLPVLALTVGVIALLDDRLELANFQSPVLIVVLVGATLLVIAGQAFATREMMSLQREVATRRFDERLTELVRRSSDMIAICDIDGVIRYASPSSESLLNIAPVDLAGKSIETVLGDAGAEVRAVFDQVVRTAHSEQIAQFTIKGDEERSFKMVIANLLHVESIRGVTLNIRDISDATRLNDQLRTLAFHDPLTLLANRALFADRVHQALRHIGDGFTPAVLFIDLDNFKTVNDSLGHSAGDALLRAFAHRLVQCTRSGDTVARLGGDEFAVLIDHSPDEVAALAVAQQVIDACREPFEIDGQIFRFGASIGVALSDRVSNVERLMRNADAAMYSAKSHGKGRAEVFQPEMLRAARRRVRIENELATAIETQQLEAHYQPIVDLQSRHLVGVEALMRWQHPTRGCVMPGEFIPLAEETGQIVPMTQWILRRACEDAMRLQRGIPHGEGVRVSVNVSSRYLNHGSIGADVRAALAATGLAADCLILEVTEGLLLGDAERLTTTFNELKRIGVRLALDDFGTGYSSLAYLHRFPIDILKVDRSFVARLAREDDAGESADAGALAKAILSLADALGLDTVAEGIELEAQREELLALGCKTGQGYAFGKAMPIDQVFEAAVTRRRGVLAGNIAGAVEYSATGRFRSIGEH
jgi:diguanylate cyclase (GGDEF)-like protein/PAS domain S-box-containing protein